MNNIACYELVHNLTDNTFLLERFTRDGKSFVLPLTAERFNHWTGFFSDHGFFEDNGDSEYYHVNVTKTGKFTRRMY